MDILLRTEFVEGKQKDSLELGIKQVTSGHKPNALPSMGAFLCSWPKFLKEFQSRARGCSEDSLLSSVWISIGSELSSLNFNSSVRAKESIAIRYPNLVIESLCDTLDICLNYYPNAYLWSRILVRVLSVVVKDAILKRTFRIMLLNRLAENRAHECN